MVDLKIAVSLLVLLPTLASAECLTYEQAKKQWPHQYLSWHGKDHCWYSPNKKAKGETVPPSEPTPTATTVPEVSAPVVEAPAPASTPSLTEEILVRYGMDRVVAAVQSPAVDEQGPNRSAASSAPRLEGETSPYNSGSITMLRAIGFVMTGIILLVIGGVIISKMILYRTRDLT